MFDFPNSPSVGQRVTGVGGIVYVWDGVKWTNSVGGVTVQSMGDVGRNLIHNPLFNIAQRGPGPFTVNVYSLDRWIISHANDTISVAQATVTDGSRAQIGDEAAESALSNVFTGSATVGSYTLILQAIENVRRLAGKTVTVSFWAAALSGTPKLGVSMDQNFGTGGSPSAVVNGNGQAITLSTTWTRYSVTITLPSITGKTLGTAGDSKTQLVFWYSAEASFALRAGAIGVQSGTVFLWGVQLEIGSVATPLEKPDPRYDLSNCQRFYQAGTLQLLGAAYTPAVYISSMVGFNVTMRANPFITPTWTTQTNTTAPGVTPMSAMGFIAYVQGTAAGTILLVGNYAASADL
jgi:hypothetical protein